MLPPPWIRLPRERQREVSRRSEKKPRQLGFQLLEVLVVLLIAGLILGLGIPSLLTMSRRLRVEMAANELQGALRYARSIAVRRSTNVALKFHISPDGRRISYVLYRDGDGDGVLTRDIESGVDPPESLPMDLAHMGAHVRFGFPQGPAPRDPSDPRRRLTRLDDPIRLNRSDMASFSPLGESTPGSLYLTDGLDNLAVVRIFGRTAKVKVMLYDREREVWE